MIDHIGLSVANFEKSKSFFCKILEPLGFFLVHEVTAEQSGSAPYAGFGPKNRPQFWIGPGKGHQPPVHIAFEAASRKAVDAFYEVAIANGGRDNGKPGIREHYHPNYYGAFVLDADGNNIEAVCHKAE